MWRLNQKNGEQVTTGVNVKLDEDTSLDMQHREVIKDLQLKLEVDRNLNDLTNRQYSVKFETKSMI